MFYPCCGWRSHRNLVYLGLLLLLYAASEYRREGDTWCDAVLGEQTARGSFGCSLFLPFLQFFVGVFVTPIIGGMSYLSPRQPAIAARWSGSRISLLWALLVQLAASAPQTTRRLPTVSPDMAQLLAVMTLSKANLSPIRLHPDGNVAKARQMEDLL
jgi:hypothetical protein